MAVANLTRQPRGRFSSVTADELAQRLAMSRPTAVRMVELAVAVNEECAATGDALAAGRLTRSSGRCDRYPCSPLRTAIPDLVQELSSHTSWNGPISGPPHSCGETSRQAWRRPTRWAPKTVAGKRCGSRQGLPSPDIAGRDGLNDDDLGCPNCHAARLRLAHGGCCGQGVRRLSDH
jgi:hypothetical protein